MARLQCLNSFQRDWKNPKKIGHNTIAWRDGSGDFAILYHHTVIVQYSHSDGVLYVNTGGWYSMTTLQRIRFGLSYLNLDLSTQDLKGKWRVMDHKGNAFTIRGNNICLERTNYEWKRVAAE